MVSLFQDLKRHGGFGPSLYHGPAVTKERCMICGGTDLSIAGEGVLMCPSCSKNRLVSSWSDRYVYMRTIREKHHVLRLGVTLSDDQSRAAKALRERLGTGRDVEVRAVCGAGKTEIVMPAILDVLKDRGVVGYVVPRIAIAAQLRQRFTRAFPSTPMAYLGGGETLLGEEPLVMMVLQRVWHFIHAFDLLIVDESDAFPLRGNPRYARLLRRALKKNGRAVWMSATGQKGSPRATIRINRRFHGHVLDVPDYVRIRKLKTKVRRGRCPNGLARFLKQASRNEAPVFLFVPTTAIGRTLQDVLGAHGYDSVFVCAGSADKRHLLRRRHDITVTTTVLERGVTFARLWVAVIMADHPVFDADTLVQIAGRTGRKPEAPHGKVVFFAERLGVAMDRAIKTIEAINRDEPHAL